MCSAGARNRFLVYFANELIPFRWPEIEGITALFNLSIKWREKTTKPFAIVESACEKDIRTLCSRSLLIKSAHELWCEGTTKAMLFEDMKKSPLMHLPQFAGSDRSFKITVMTFNKKTTTGDKVAKIEEMAFLPFEGPINLKNPDNEFTFLEYYARDQNTETQSNEPVEYYFGRFICDSSKRYQIHKYSLKDRKFISNTSMDPKLSTIMANIAKVNYGDFVLDPFVGSGSILVAAAEMGALVFGSDIDYKLLHGLSRPSRPNVKKREADETVFGNLTQYSMSSHFGDVVLADASRPVFRDSFKFDAVICDPPYGIREPIERIGTDKVDFKIPEEMLPLHFPAKIRYGLKEIIKDLLDFSSKVLQVGNRVVFWMPMSRNNEGQIIDFEHPHHECMETVCFCEQELTKQCSRVLICMEKVRELSSCRDSSPAASPNGDIIVDSVPVVDQEIGVSSL
jgi:tRNA (guanine10-N2)-methyltransferase